MSGARANLEELVGDRRRRRGDDARRWARTRTRSARTARRSSPSAPAASVTTSRSGWRPWDGRPTRSSRASASPTPIPAANDALAVFACVGNPVAVRTGAAAGAVGTVIGKHESFRAYKHVLVHVGDDTLEQIAPGDELLVRACGRGMSVAGAAGHRLPQPRPRALARLGAAPSGRPARGRGDARPPARGRRDGQRPRRRRHLVRPPDQGRRRGARARLADLRLGRPRRGARLGRDALHGLPRRRRHRRRRRQRRQPARRQRARGDACSSRPRTGRSSPSSTLDANLATMLGLVR